MDPIVVVGAGISGIACARTLTAAGLPVSVVDRGRRIGGRMASRQLEGRPVDLGASYFTVSDERFGAVVEGWEAAGLARPWTDTFLVLQEGRDPETKTGPMRWGSAGGTRSLVEDLAAGLEVHQGEVELVGLSSAGTPLVDGRPAAAVVLAMPDPQARRLLAPGLQAEDAALDHLFEPVLALAACWSERQWDATFHGAFVNVDPQVAWIADDGRRRGDDAPVLVAHSTTTYAAAHLADPQATAPAMLAALQRLLDIGPAPSTTYLHRWSLARPATPRDQPFLLGDTGVGACGDGWASPPKVEGAYLSGLELGEALVARLR